ncbi:autotransporter domain protein [Campylobacter avium LMG 24591]|uniref:Autotransporter domain protein n=1 Tax=Campylobacter avium LMG 24591 TaxID=522484 RepID=A0A222MYL8_9BACT|nr:autotransporter outer membrane beta-barrel domain-containing protein [Campylobacter avium]ASQ31083.1 autotransporter domain protein [Campylobacter avium LMG 24591]
MIPEYPSPRLDVIIAEGLDMDFSLPFYFNIPANEKTIFLVDLKKIRNEAIAIYEGISSYSGYKRTVYNPRLYTSDYLRIGNIDFQIRTQSILDAKYVDFLHQEPGYQESSIADDFLENNHLARFSLGKEGSVYISGDLILNGNNPNSIPIIVNFENDGSRTHSNFIVNGEIARVNKYLNQTTPGNFRIFFSNSITDIKNVKLNNFIALQANKGFSDDFMSLNNEATAFLHLPYQQILSNKDINLESFQSTINLKPLLDYTVSYERNENSPSYVFINGDLSEKARNMDEFLSSKRNYLQNSLLAELENLNNISNDANIKSEYEKAIADINTQIEALDKFLNADATDTQDSQANTNSNSQVNSSSLSGNASNTNSSLNSTTDSVLNSNSSSTMSEAKQQALKEYNSLFIKDEQILELSTNLIDKNIANSGLKNYVIFEMLNSPSHKAEVASSINKSAKSIANSNSAISSQQQIINLTNEAAINARMVYLKNPYKSDEEKMGNMAYDEAGRTYATFINNTDNGLWANFFGGKNILNSNSASVLGGSLGFDKRISDDSLLGLYLTYADVNLKDSIINEEGKSYQLGLYYNKNFANNMELDLKANFGFNPAKQNYMLGSYDTSSSFTRNYYTISASVGKVVDLADNGGTSIKHFIGVNYYNTYTPAYNTRSDFSLEHKSYAASAISFDLGIGLKQYFNENSFFFIGPKIEHFASNDASFYNVVVAGSNNVITIDTKEVNKNRTYAQILAGGKVDLNNDGLALNLSLAAKSLISKRVYDNADSFISGQVGIRWEF